MNSAAIPSATPNPRHPVERWGNLVGVVGVAPRELGRVVPGALPVDEAVGLFPLHHALAGVDQREDGAIDDGNIRGPDDLQIPKEARRALVAPGIPRGRCQPDNLHVRAREERHERVLLHVAAGDIPVVVIYEEILLGPEGSTGSEDGGGKRREAQGSWGVHGNRLLRQSLHTLGHTDPTGQVLGYHFALADVVFCASPCGLTSGGRRHVVGSCDSRLLRNRRLRHHLGPGPGRVLPIGRRPS
jgi:hypothetical protein